MKTIGWLKISFILQAVFVSFCIFTLSFFFLNRLTDYDIFFHIADRCVIGWILNPAGIITPLIGLMLYFCECANPKHRSEIGHKRIWFPAFFVADLALYLLSAAFLVAITGGV